jgi:hypothetical protein
MTTDEILNMHSEQASQEAQDLNAPYAAKVTVPLSALFDRGRRFRVNATLTPELLQEADKILGERERSAAIELGLQFVLYLKGSDRFTPQALAEKLSANFGQAFMQSAIEDLSDALCQSHE